jgi:hypothetical protein
MPAQPASKTCVIALAALLACGCATLSEEDCQGGDWYRIGLADGRTGAAPERLARHVEACAEHGVSIDREQYAAGRSDGLQHYCTRANGFKVGRDGFGYANACPSGREAEFLAGYGLGRRFYAVDRELARIDADLRNYRQRLGDETLSDEQRDRIESLLRDLESQRWRAGGEYRRLELELREL